MAFEELFYVEEPLIVYGAIAMLIFIVSFAVLKRVIGNNGGAAIAGLAIGLLSFRYFMQNGFTFQNPLINFIITAVLVFFVLFLFMNSFVKSKGTSLVISGIIALALSYYAYSQGLFESDNYLLVIFGILILGVLAGIISPFFKSMRHHYRR